MNVISKKIIITLAFSGFIAAMGCAKIDHNPETLAANNTNAAAAIPNADCDGDGLIDSEETTIGTNPSNPDTDNDGLPDGEEVQVYNSNPLVGDTDFDGLPDGAEVNTFHTSPTMADTDGGGLKDGEEIKKGLKPLLDTDDASGAPKIYTCS